MTYVSANDVFRVTGLSNVAVDTLDVSYHIQEAENIVCLLTKNIYWNRELDNQLATGGANTTIVKTGSNWITNSYANMYVWIYSGLGSSQIKKILSNTNDTLTVENAWITNPDNTSYFRIFYVPFQFNPHIQASYDGNGQNYYYLPFFPVNQIDGLTIAGSVIPLTNILSWNNPGWKTGRIELKSASINNVYPSYGQFPILPRQGIVVDFWYGVDILPYEIRRLVELQAGIQTLSQLLGSKYEIINSVGLPEFTINYGNPHTNIRGTIDDFQQEFDRLLTKIVKVYPVFG